MKKNKKLISAILSTALVATSMFFNVSYAEETSNNVSETVDMRVLATTDLHTNLVNYDYYQDKPSEKIGLAKTAVLIEAAKKENSNTLLVDNGDIIQGTPLGTYVSTVNRLQPGQNHPMYKALEVLGFDIGTLGNHEFNYGLDFLDTVIKGTKIPLVNANVQNMDGTPKYKQYEIITKKYVNNLGKTVDIRVGVTGIVPPQILNWDKVHLEGKIKVEDSIKSLEKIVPKMKEAGADVVVVLSHSGIGDAEYVEGEENIGFHISKIPGVDAIVTGHSHATFPGDYKDLPSVDAEKGLINGKPTVMAGKYGDHLGVIDLKLTKQDNKWVVTDSKGEIRKIDSKSNIADNRILEVAKEAHEGTINYVRKSVGETSSDITSYFSLVKDDPSVQIVNNAQIWYAKKELKGTQHENLPVLSAAAPFKAGTRGDATAYTNIPKGGIAIKNVADLYLYDNITAVVKVNGAQLKEWLEMSSGLFNTVNPESKEPQNIVNTDYRTYNFDVIDGVTYEFDITQPNKYDKDGKVVNANASRVRNLKYLDKDVTADQEFIVVTNNYRMSSPVFPGVSSASYKELLGLENRQVIINYLTELKTINPTADNNWTFVNNLKGLDLRFLTADSAKNLVANSSDIKYLKPSDKEGFGEYRYIQEEKKSDSGILETPKKNNTPVDIKGVELKDDDSNRESSESSEENPKKVKSEKQEETLSATGNIAGATYLLGLSILVLVLILVLRRKFKN
ncbi:bifunctional 2',3'-cyclic-nucleotide 2'-phosphodiesterase/3'-nucleotidase [Gemelliphila palaticanis]|uniref:Bifunctional 2',3'-cyclic-nucleotide 2'-phosphodiesterase/3'-nucleotidase n=1 Tax=Gemelliphila palaticanis TaxID=81950 RepID=A0ABX2SZY8_9BACL|nr:bifunctional 2',3'-cyclic-nucleotide 2'-phosphodiesterase/3'-nucleotidase [Gemella palaticanis]MBF0715935.1 bifunctional 2',3'-cyclic-nucleotide 2'-phosphodiesterase/3'-nucleotidase [Gemella palaticanis]NYS47865.1 bifunctional 2',3'-cyclic-nucleotide 2'-phosphodiesterase/3'-nucleotidase [Gemella palaticanis]